MAIANHFYNETTKKYVAIFGTIFNQLKVVRKTSTGTQQSMIVPLSYAPFQKVLARLNADPDLINSRRTAITLPRMSFEISNITYDPARKIASTQKMRKTGKAESDDSRFFLYSSVPYNLDFQLYIMTKYQEDATQLMEQVLPFFTPDWTVSARMVPDLDPMDIPIILNSITTEDIYEGDFETRQSILYTLSFTMKGYYFGPEKKRKVIKFVDVDLATDTLANTAPEERITVQPGIDQNGNPVTLRGETAKAVATLNSGRVDTITITDDGQAYNSNNTPTVTITAPSTSNANATASIANTSITSITVDTGGGYYSSIPNVLISNPDLPSANATAEAVITGDTITSINVTDPGRFYASANVAISLPPTKSPYIKFGTDAWYADDANDGYQVGTTSTNYITSGQGIAVEFWIYPTEAPATGVYHVLQWFGGTMSIEIEPDLEIVYRPAFNGPPIRSTPEILILNQWNHVRVEHFGSNAKWLVNGVVDAGGNAAAGFLQGGGIPIYLGKEVVSAGTGHPSFRGAIDNLIIETGISGQTPGPTYTMPSAPKTGNELTEDFEMVPATANVQVSAGEVTGITIIEGGANYANTTPTITITTPNDLITNYAASANAVLTDGVVTSINIIDSGKFYQTANVSIDPAASITAVATATIDLHGDISAITITNPGAGYTSVPTVTISDPAATSIPYQDIEFDDNWGVITIIEDV